MHWVTYSLDIYIIEIIWEFFTFILIILKVICDVGNHITLALLEEYNQGIYFNLILGTVCYILTVITVLISWIISYHYPINTLLLGTLWTIFITNLFTFIGVLTLIGSCILLKHKPVPSKTADQVQTTSIWTNLVHYQKISIDPFYPLLTRSVSAPFHWCIDPIFLFVFSTLLRGGGLTTFSPNKNYR